MKTTALLERHLIPAFPLTSELPEYLRQPNAIVLADPDPAGGASTLDENERALIAAAVEKTGGNRKPPACFKSGATRFVTK